MGMDAGTPPGLVERIRLIVAEEVRKFARSGFLRNASITGGGGLSIRDGGGLNIGEGGDIAVGPGGTILLQHPDGKRLMLMGAYDGASAKMPDGSPQPMALLYRADGTVALSMYDPDPNTNGFQQFLALWDRSGNIIMSDDTDSGQGLARPYVPGVFYRSDWDNWVSVTGTSFVTKFRARMPKQQPRLYVRAWAGNDTGGSSGEVRVLVNGSQWGPVHATTFSINEYEWGPFPVSGDHMSMLTVELQARVASGAGGVRFEPSRVEGQQS